MKNHAFRVILASYIVAGIAGSAYAADRVDVAGQREAAALRTRQLASGGRDAASESVTSAAPVTLTLLNGWTGAPYFTNQPSVQLTDDVVRFKGAIMTSGTNANPFVLPKKFWPKAVVYVPVDLCNAANGRVIIDTAGFVTVQAAGDFSSAQCFTSLDGVHFSKSAKGYDKLKLLNGWADTPYGTAVASARISNGTVQFQGSMTTSGTDAVAFKLPKTLRPSANVYVPVDLCNANNGRLYITKDGTAYVEAETDFGDAQCFTSLDGVSFTLAGDKLKLLNDWTDTPYGTNKPGIDNQDGVVHFVGAITTTGTNTQPFKLPVTARPSAETYVKVDLCDAANGRLHISPDGTVSVQAETEFSSAQCFTSLDGATFVQ